MRRLLPIRLLALLLIVPGAALPSRGPAQQPAKSKTVRLLTVGNSFSQNATRFLGDIVKSGGHVLVHHQAAIGGATMAQHLDKLQVHLKDAKDPKGLYSSGRSLPQELAEPWDYITIQQASIKSHDVANYRPSARQLYDYIKSKCPGAEVLVHQTWAYRVDDPRFGKATAPPGEPATRQAMHEGLTAAYDTIAQELGTRIIPVGDAFHLADSDPKWGFKPDRSFDVKNAALGKLPDQTYSLHVGWRWAKGKDAKTTLAMDGHHASDAGQYLAACVFFEVLYATSVVGNTFIPRGIDAAYARFLQETAHKAAQARRRP